jgi:hypothetical protein
MYDFSGVPNRETAEFLTDEQYGEIRRSVLATPHDSVKLYNPDAAGLKYGEGGALESGGERPNIVFGEVEPHFAIVRADHPYLDPDSNVSIWRRNGHIVLVEVGSDFTNAKRVVENDEAVAAPAPEPRRTVTVGSKAGKARKAAVTAVRKAHKAGERTHTTDVKPADEVAASQFRFSHEPEKPADMAAERERARNAKEAPQREAEFDENVRVTKESFGITPAAGTVSAETRAANTKEKPEVDDVGRTTPAQPGS